LHSPLSRRLAEIVGFLDDVLASMDGEVALPLSPNWKIRVVNFLTNPFTKQSLLTATGLSEIFTLTPRNDGTQENASLDVAGEVFEEIVKMLMTMPDGPSTTIYCQGDEDCGNADWACNGYSDNAGVCASDMQTACTSGSTCPSSYCVFDTCDLGGPTIVDETKVDAAFDTDPPAFVNEALLDSLEGAF